MGTGPLGLSVLPNLVDTKKEERAKRAHDRALFKQSQSYAKKYHLKKLRAMQIKNRDDQGRFFKFGFTHLSQQADDFDHMIAAAIGLRADAHPKEPDLPW